MAAPISFLLRLLTLQILISGALSTTFSVVNKCDYTVWPAILSNPGVPPLSITGFLLHKGDSNTISAPPSWAGRFWGRTLCSEDSTGKFSCVTGDCGLNKVECAGNGAEPPATLAEFTLDGAGGLDLFDVSLVEGFNIPMLVVPRGGTGEKCTGCGCVVDLNDACPTELKVTSVDGGKVVACKSACEAFNQPPYCCSGEYATPDSCKPSTYSQEFKTVCPRAYTHVYDNETSTYSCANADYVIIFCPSPNTGKESIEGQTTNPPPIRGTMVDEGANLDQSEASPTMFPLIVGVVGVVMAVPSCVVAILQIRRLL